MVHRENVVPGAMFKLRYRHHCVYEFKVSSLRKIEWFVYKCPNKTPEWKYPKLSKSMTHRLYEWPILRVYFIELWVFRWFRSMNSLHTVMLWYHNNWTFKMLLNSNNKIFNEIICSFIYQNKFVCVVDS